MLLWEQLWRAGRAGEPCRRCLEHAYLIDEEGLEMAREAGTYVIPTMQMT